MLYYATDFRDRLLGVYMLICLQNQRFKCYLKTSLEVESPDLSDCTVQLSRIVVQEQDNNRLRPVQAMLRAVTPLYMQNHSKFTRSRSSI